MSPSPKILAVAGPLEGRSFELGDGGFSVGRQGDNRLHLRQIAISRHHCVIEAREGSWFVRDLDSRHGTFVNGRPITERRLAHGDFITFGENTFLFLLREAASEETSGLVRFGTSIPEGSTTVHLRPEDDLLARPQLALAAMPESVRKARALATLLEMSQAIHSRGTVEDLAGELVDRLLAVVPGERGTVLLVEPGGELTAAGSRRWAGTGSPHHGVPVSRALVDRVLEERSGTLLGEIATEAGDDGPAPIRSLLCVPLVLGVSPLGVVYLDSRDPEIRFETEHLELATGAAAIAAVALGNAREREASERERRRLRADQLAHDMVGESPATRRVLALLARIAPTGSTVLVTGESGCGKELAARAIHCNSPRAEKPFVAVNCATLTEALLESELFGHERGAFTGAVERKLGKFELADGGTLFLDEVGEIPLALQARLLRVLQEREFERVGGRGPISVDVRLVAATNRDLAAEVRRGAFREDLYYRLDVLHVTLPPLRDRREDVPLLAAHFLRRHGERLKRPSMRLSPEARAALVAYDWPGNVRELANVVERAVVLAEGDLVRPEDLPESLFESGRSAGTEGVPRYHEALRDFKRRLVIEALAESGGNVTRAAERLGIAVSYLHRLMTNLDLRDEVGDGGR